MATLSSVTPANVYFITTQMYSMNPCVYCLCLECIDILYCCMKEGLSVCTPWTHLLNYCIFCLPSALNLSPNIVKRWSRWISQLSWLVLYNHSSVLWWRLCLSMQFQLSTWLCDVISQTWIMFCHFLHSTATQACKVSSYLILECPPCHFFSFFT
jgi:hypothetical protein